MVKMLAEVQRHAGRLLGIIVKFIEINLMAPLIDGCLIASRPRPSTASTTKSPSATS